MKRIYDSLMSKAAAAAYLLGPKYKKSYSQCGEDLIVARLLKGLGVAKPFYVDIGANDPVIYSNTYLFYANGARGICVEPNPAVCGEIRKKRPQDVCIQAGAGPTSSTQKFFIMEKDELSTFSEQEAAAEAQKGIVLVGTADIRMMTFMDLVAENKISSIDFLSIDVEGLDLEILQGIDFAQIRPKVICVETQSFGRSEAERSRRASVQRLMEHSGYVLGGSTPINSIYVDSHLDIKA